MSPAVVPPEERRSAKARALWRMRGYLRPYYGVTAWSMVAAVASTAASLAIPILIQHVVDGPVRHGDTRGLLLLGALAVALGLLEGLLSFIRRWAQSASSAGMEAKLREDLYAHLQRLPIEFHDRWQSGQLLSRATADLSTIRRFLSFGLFFFVLNVATYIAVSALLIHLYWPLGVLVTLSAIPLFVISRRFTARYFAASRELQDELGDLTTRIEESAQGIRVIRSFGRRAYMGERFGEGARRVHDLGVGKSRMIARTLSQFDLVPNVTLTIVLVAGAVLVARGELTIGALVAFVALQGMLVWPIDLLGWIIANAQEAMSASVRIYEVFDTPPSITDRPGAVEVSTVEGRLRFEGVAFGYEPGRPVLHRIDLDVAPGETVAIVGLTGSGKTTLVSLVPRLYDVDAGRITIDGHDVRDLKLDSLRRIVGTAFEDPTLFSMSVRENLTLGRVDATEDEIAEALEIAQAQFAYELPWGLDTRVGEQGLSLSGGQRQRLALARAVVGRPRVLVLDDPLSALDVHTEALVESALSTVLAGTTALLVVHRPSTVALADRVALLEDGRLTAIGTHSELMAHHAGYRDVLRGS
ncbi:ABC transporter ATP-binding protein [Dactylosporangium sp. AC04546]|uniref:ABC transporter ATP-binding protein n=1 Tax=Dactylosporangium sp. AC04546 TaxID=2862460 RepID=UPI001EDDCB4C|nr:ABC transporter ATP-binding protein [Dactylosporangium sp. AC04546]WVK84804.1 ABC transporter ATP-binding protein [Dactylosporangium sp. AC04546]